MWKQMERLWRRKTGAARVEEPSSKDVNQGRKSKRRVDLWLWGKKPA